MLSVPLFDNNDYTECWCPTDNRQATTSCSEEWQLIKDSVQRNHGRECQSRRDSCMRCSCQSVAAVMHTRAWRLPLWRASIPGVGAQFLCATGKRRGEDNVKFNVSCTYRTSQDFLQQGDLMKVSYFNLIRLSVYTVKCRKFDTGLLYVKIAVNVGSTWTACRLSHVRTSGRPLATWGASTFWREGEWWRRLLIQTYWQRPKDPLTDVKFCPPLTLVAWTGPRPLPQINQCYVTAMTQVPRRV
jgi:hypothetical protein